MWWLTDSCKGQLVALALIPILLPGVLQRIAVQTTGAVTVPSAWLSRVTVSFWLIMFVLLLFILRKRLRYLTEVIRLENGLALRAPFSRRHVSWEAITELVDVGNRLFMITTRYGEYFLSTKLSGCRELCEIIQAEIQPPEVNYKLNSQIDEEAINRGHDLVVSVPCPARFI